MRILLATDGSSHSREAAAQCGEFIPNNSDIEIRLVTVLDFGIDFDSAAFESQAEFVDIYESERKKTAKGILDNAEKIIRFKNEDVKISRVTLEGSAKKEIVEEADHWNADLIVIGSHGNGFWKRALLGSVSDGVLHNAQCSVLIAKAPSNPEA